MSHYHSASRRQVLAQALGFSLSVGFIGAAPGRARAQAWPSGAAGAVSLTYDDGLDSQLDNAAPELDRRGLKATFFLTEENMAGRLADWEALARKGHEIANHTVSHPCDLRRYGAARFERQEVAPMKRFLANNFGAAESPTFAYPCGYLGLGEGERRVRFGRYEHLLRRDFQAARTTAGGPNLPSQALADRFRLHAFEPTYDGDLLAPAARYLRQTADRGAWAILVFHNVVPQWRGEGDASIAMHAKILDLVQAHGFWCAPMGRVFEHLTSRT